MATSMEPKITEEAKAIMKAYIEPIPKAERQDEYRRIALEVGVTPNTVRSWFSNRPLPPNYMHKFQRAVRNQILARDVRPDLF